MVAIEGGDKIHQCDVIEHEGEKWLVPYWRHSKIEEWSEPARIVRLSAFRHKWRPGGKFGDGIVNDPIPKALLDHQTPLTEANADLAQDRPPIRRVVRRRLN